MSVKNAREPDGRDVQGSDLGLEEVRVEMLGGNRLEEEEAIRYEVRIYKTLWNKVTQRLTVRYKLSPTSVSLTDMRGWFGFELDVIVYHESDSEPSNEPQRRYRGSK